MALQAAGPRPEMIGEYEIRQSSDPSQDMQQRRSGMVIDSHERSVIRQSGNEIVRELSGAHAWPGRFAALMAARPVH